MIVVLGFVLAVTIKNYRSLDKKYKVAVENTKAYCEQFSSTKNKNRAFKLTMEQLKHSNDSIFKELNDTRKALKIKDSKLQSLLHVASSFSRVDTINIGDTVFRDPQLCVDTLLSDDWYSLKLGLKYPSAISVAPEFKSIKNIVVSSKRETVNPPKRFFLFRWFQRKHTVINIDVTERNPYVKNQTNRYVEIVK